MPASSDPARSENFSLRPSSRLWIRAGVLMLALILIKSCLLWGLGAYIFQEHWRIGSWYPRWPEYSFYGLFLVLIGTLFVLPAKRLAGAPRRPVILFLVFFGFFGLLFALLGLYRMSSNYIQPLIDGFLKWRDIWSYLELDLFYDKPFLAAFLGAAILGTWILFRAGRKTWIFYFLGLLSLAYLTYGIRKPYDYAPDVVICVCAGLAGAIGCRFSKKPLGLFWQALILLPGLLSILWFALKDDAIKYPEPCLVGLLVAGGLVLLAGNYLARMNSALAPFSYFMPFCFLTFFLLSSHHYPLSANYNHVLVYGMTLPRYVAQETLIVILLLGICLLIGKRYPRTSRLVFDLIAGVLVLLALVDVQTYRSMAFRLDWNALVISNDPVLLWRTIKPFVAPLFIGLALYVLFYAALLHGLMKMAASPGGRNILGRMKWNGGLVCTSALIVMMMLTGHWLIKADKADGYVIGHIFMSSPMVTSLRAGRLTDAEFTAMAKQIGIGEAEKRSRQQLASNPPPKDWNVFMIVLESSYNRYLSFFGAKDETQPMLRKYLDRMELFPNFYSTYPSSLNARFTIMSGLYACKPYATYVNPRVESTCLLDIFRQRGYKVSLFDSCDTDYQRWNDYIRAHSVDFNYDSRNMPGQENSPKVSWGVMEQVTMEAIKNQFHRHTESKERFFLTYFPVMPHMPFDTPSKEFDKFDNGVGQLTKNYTGRYKNQLLYIDWVVTSLLDELQKLNQLDNTLVIITDDHGELVGEDSPIVGHGWNVEPRLCNVPLIVMNPEKPGAKTNAVLGSQVDILPTLLDLMRIPLPKGELYEGVSLYSPEAARERPVYITSPQQRAVIRGSRYYMEDIPASGEKEQRIYEIQINGTSSSFPLLKEKLDITAEMDLFDRFQKSLILRYPHWKKHWSQSN